MKRTDQWLPRLHDYVERVRRTPHDYGSFDCALFCGGAFEAMTGFDPSAEFRGRYKTLTGGLKLLRKKGFGNHADYLATFTEEVHPAEAQVGDFGVIPLDDAAGCAIGVVGGAHILVVQPGAAGVGVIDLLHASRAMRIPLA